VHIVRSALRANLGHYAISEFRILTNTASAEFGHSAGSTTNIVTRSGSNQFHGAAYDFLRNDVLDARNFFSQNVEPLKQNQFRGTLGGPIHHDKTFFLAITKASATSRERHSPPPCRWRWNGKAIFRKPSIH
jgi:hypothetical protein